MEKNIKTLAIVQARMNSTRLPNKVMRLISGMPMIELLLKRLSCSDSIDKIIIATPTSPDNESLVQHVSKLGYEVFQGSEKNVLDRYYNAAKLYKPEAIVRITGDCPLIDPAIIDEITRRFYNSNVDYISNTCPPTFPDGLDASVFSFRSLECAHKEATSDYEHEHVVPFIRESGLFRLGNYSNSVNHSKERWTVDEISDFEVVKSIFEYFHPRYDFGWQEVLNLKEKAPDLFLGNQYITRNEGINLNTGQKLWKRAKKIIPGGNMLLSKRPEMFLPDYWPSYYSKAKGCRVWDLDGNEFVDMSIMGIGTNILGYGNSVIDETVNQVICSGNMSTLNCPEEVYLAEKLVELHPWAEMVRFTRSGGEANAVAIRIARVASGKQNIAFCGYHGWHDWYLAANLLNKKNLTKHLLPGLDPKGVPDSLKGTVYPFKYNDYQELEMLIDKHNIGVIKMEVSRNEAPIDGFLNQVRDLASRCGIVLIFDECTSGFRQTFGGLHKYYKVEPDIAVFGKALGNGYAISSIIGRREIMDAAQSTFISSTFWTERIGPAAGLKTLEVMEKLKSWEKITKTGQEIEKRWESLARKYSLPIKVFGLSALIKFSINSKSALAYKTFITQEMLSKGYLAGNSVYVCTEHTPDILDGYFNAIEPIFATIQECENDRDIMSLLNGPICHSEFKRLN